MKYFVYIIYSDKLEIYYKGFTQNVPKRLHEHNNNLSNFTTGKGPWRLIVVESFETKQEALLREKSLKKCKKDYFLWLSKQPSNIASHFEILE